jgi:hypothetical protein
MSSVIALVSVLPSSLVTWLFTERLRQIAALGFVCLGALFLLGCLAALLL